MSKFLKGAMVALLVVGFTGCAVKTDDIHAKAYKSANVDLSTYKTYQIVEGSGIDKESAGPWTTSEMDVKGINTELEKIVSDELNSKGKTQVSKNPDLYVAYGAAANEEVIEAKLDKNGIATIKEIPAAAMILVLIDAKTHKIVWMSAAEGEAKGLPADQREKRIKFAVKSMLGGL